MDSHRYTRQTVEEVIRELKTSSSVGLTKAKIEKRLRFYGPNLIKGELKTGWEIFLRQFRSSFIYLLTAAAFLAILLGEPFDGLMIFIFIVINTSLGFYQEFRSEKTSRLLKTYINSYVKVIRDGQEQSILTEDLIPGDIIILETGDKVPADIRFIETYNVAVDESILTGESAPVKKSHQKCRLKGKEIYQATNLGFSGTSVVSGKAKGVVLATGSESAIGKIAHLTIETRRVSGFEKGLTRFSTFILRLVLTTLLLIFLINIFIKMDRANIGELAIFSIALAVSVVPEALPVVTTFSLSRGALRLAKQKVIVKRLSAIEDLGGIEILCTDKTGTLTENKLKVSALFPKFSSEALLYANLAAASPNKKKIEPFDNALWKALSQEKRKVCEKYQRVSDLPFDPIERRNSVLLANAGRYEVVTRGAPETILNICPNLEEKEKHLIEEWLSRVGRQGNRVIAVAQKAVNTRLNPEPQDLLKLRENNFSFVGLIAFKDPIKKTTFEAINQAKKLGVKIKILTGDSKEVAGAVAHKIKLVSSPDQVITGQELDNLEIAKQHAAVENYSVFARMTPEQKYKIIQLLQEQYDVGFLGEGINDAPALKIAEVSLVVQTAADIAREAADIVLLKKDLKIIIDGIQEGRQVFTNTVKYIRATLTSNFGNFYAVAIASLFIDFLPMLPLQILLLNLLSDFPMIAIATDNIDKVELGQPKKYDVKDITLLATILGIVSTIFDFIFFGIFYRISPGVLQTNWFLGSILTELILLFSIRTQFFFIRAPRPSSAVLLLTGTAFFTTLALPFTLFGQRIFYFVRPTNSHLALILAIVGFYFLCSEGVKLLYYRNLNHNH